MIARKRFGQHFLEPAWVAKVVEAIHPTLNDEFVEIGPGRAALPKAQWTRASDTMILHGRRICRPTPLCDMCAVQAECDYYNTVILKSRRATRPLRKARR